MAVVVYDLPVPELELTLVAGGSLLPNTTYYFATFYSVNYGGQSKLSVQQSITTDTTNLTIKVKTKWLNGGSYDYNKPTLPFTYSGATVSHNIVWDTIDMTDGSGNYVFRKTAIALLTGTGTTYNVNYTTAPAKANQFYSYIPELYAYSDPILPASFSKIQGIPIIYNTSTADTWTTVLNAIKAATSFTNYIYTQPTEVIIMANFYFVNAVTMNDLNLGLIYTNFYSLGTHNRCNITNLCNSNIVQIGGGISITNGSDCVLKGYRYRQGFTITGNNNSIYAFNGQVALGKDVSSVRKYIGCFLLTNGFNNNNNFSMYNSLLYDQALSTNQINSNIYQSTDSATIYWAHDWTFINGFDNTPYSLTITDYVIDTNRATSEGINYSVDKKPRISWNISTGTYVNKTLVLKDTIKIYLKDENGSNISGATVSIVNGFETVSGTTDENGYLALVIKTRTAVQDPAYTTSTYYTIWTDYTDLTVTISKSGYETHKDKINTLTGKTILSTLKPIIPTRQTIDGKLLIANQPSLGSSSKLLEI